MPALGKVVVAVVLAAVPVIVEAMLNRRPPQSEV